MADLSSILEKERERLNNARADALQRRQAIDDEIATIDKELNAIAAYEAAKAGKPTTARKANSGTSRGSRQEGIVAVLKDKPDGMTRGEILEALGLKGDKSGEQSISNALNNMKKGKKVGSKEGRYMLA